MRFVLSFLLTALLCSEVIAAPLIIAHRGASGYYPEHTLAAYRAAIEMGADYIEPDLVMTRDGVLIARHDLFLGSTTNVEDVFPDRQRTIEGREDWYAEDFTLAEIRQLRARQPFASRGTEYDDQFPVPTLDELLKLVKDMAAATGRQIGLYPELKHPQRHRQLGFDMGQSLLTSLEEHDTRTPVLIQSFDPEALKRLRPRTTLPLVMLVVPQNRQNPSEPNVPLHEVATFADGVGAMKYMLLDQHGNDAGFMARAREHGLFVHAWTFRNDRVDQRFDSPEAELQAYQRIGVTGIFTDYPDTAARFLRQGIMSPAP